jgi:hypothetical protein
MNDQPKPVEPVKETPKEPPKEPPEPDMSRVGRDEIIAWKQWLKDNGY